MYKFHQVSSHPSKVTSPRKFALFWKKRENTPKRHKNLNENHTIKFSVSENPTVEVLSSYLQKCGILNFLPEERSRICMCFFSFAGDRIDH